LPTRPQAITNRSSSLHSTLARLTVVRSGRNYTRGPLRRSLCRPDARSSSAMVMNSDRRRVISQANNQADGAPMDQDPSPRLVVHTIGRGPILALTSSVISPMDTEAMRQETCHPGPRPGSRCPPSTIVPPFRSRLPSVAPDRTAPHTTARLPCQIRRNEIRMGE